MKLLVLFLSLIILSCDKNPPTPPIQSEQETPSPISKRRGFIEHDGELQEIQLDHFDPLINYSRVIIIDQGEVEKDNPTFGPSLKIDKMGEEYQKKKVHLRPETLNDFNYIKDKIKEAGVFQTVASFAPFTNLLMLSISPGGCVTDGLISLWDIYVEITDNDWESVGTFIAENIPLTVKATLYNEVQLIAYKYIAGSLRTKEDAKFWQKMIKLFDKNVPTHPLIGTYSGQTYYSESNSILKISLKITMSHKKLRGEIYLENSGMTNKIDNDLHFNQMKISIINPNYINNIFQGSITSDYKTIPNFSNTMKNRLLWSTSLTK